MIIALPSKTNHCWLRCHGFGCIRLKIKMSDIQTAVLSCRKIRFQRQNLNQEPTTLLRLSCTVRWGCWQARWLVLWVCMERWPCHFPLSLWRREGKREGLGFAVDGNICEGSWHSNSQSLTVWVMDRGERCRRIAQMWDWSGGNEVITPARHNEDTAPGSSNSRLPLELEEPGRQLCLGDPAAAPCVLMCTAATKIPDRKPTTKSNHIDSSLSAAAKSVQPENGPRSWWKAVERVLYEQWLIWTFTNPHTRTQHGRCSRSCLETRRQAIPSPGEHWRAC